jgi:hypothetical protein
MKRLVFPILAAVSLAAVCIAQAADIEGTFLLVPQKSDNVVQVVESTVSKMNLFVRSYARKKVSKAAIANKKISIASSGNCISILADDHTLPTTPIDGTRTKYRNHDGDMLDIQMRLYGDTLEQTFITANGSRTNLCELSQDGKVLYMHVVIRSDYFEEPMTYNLVYHKSS